MFFCFYWKLSDGLEQESCHYPYQALPLWQVVQNYLYEQVKAYGGDRKALDAARVFRIAGSVNSKSGQVVEVQYRHDYIYQLREIQREYLPELDTDQKKKKGRPKKIVQLHNIYRLHITRLGDLRKLVELRRYDVKGYRETLCFLYRYWSCCVLEDPEEALQEMLDFNASFVEPLPEKEVLRATKSAEKAWRARTDKKANELAIEMGYPGAGYNLKNTKLIQWLDITQEEQQQLDTIINAREKQRRNTIYNRKKRQAAGTMPREQYLQQEKEKTEDKLYLLQKALQRYPDATQKALAELLNVNQSTISRLLRKCKKKDMQGSSAYIKGT
ncbi:MarR family transcriptional regulator [Aneurinibacillus sp. BA2021]|nr:MarR family transcriptional regulator [Aneurinibacillus sp. BA2021]